MTKRVGLPLAAPTNHLLTNNRGLVTDPRRPISNSRSASNPIKRHRQRKFRPCQHPLSGGARTCVVTPCSPRTSCPLTRAKAWCQSVRSLVMDRTSIASTPAPMKSYHTGYEFGVGPRNEAHVPKFLPPSCRPPLLLSWRSWVGTQSPTLVEGKQLAAVCRIKALPRLHCCALAVFCWGGAGAPASATAEMAKIL
jgi:hypothetical protein